MQAFIDTAKAIACQVRDEDVVMQHCISAYDCAITVTAHQSSGAQYPVHSLRVVTAIPASIPSDPGEAFVPAQSTQIYLNEEQVDKLIAVLQTQRMRMRKPPVKHICPVSVAEAGA